MQRLAAIVAFLLLITLRGLSQSSNTPLQVGIGIVNITGDSAVILDPLHAKAIVFKQGNQQFALIECDLTAVPQQAFMPARQRAAAVLNTPVDNIALAATHTHMASRYKDVPSAVEEAVRIAKNNLKPITVRSGIAQQPYISFNRRYFMKDGSVVFNPMFLNPDIVRPAGGVDPEVGVVMFYADSKPLTALINFALHLDVVKEYGSRYQNSTAGSPNAVSADYPFWLNEALRNHFGAAFQSIFLTGACGNINHWDFSKPGPQSGYKTKSKEIGDSLYQSIKRTMPAMQTELPSLAIRSRTIAVALQSYTAEELAWAKSVDDKTLSQKSEEPTERQQFLNAVKRRRILALDEQRRSGGNGTIQLTVQAVRISHNTALVTLPGELFVELGQTIKNHSPFANTLIVELANNNVAYVPNQKAFAQGGYEVENSRLAPGGGELLVEAAIELLKELKAN